MIEDPLAQRVFTTGLKVLRTCCVPGRRLGLVGGQGKNVEILHAVEDLIKIIRAHLVDEQLERVSEEEVIKLKKHYNHFTYQVTPVSDSFMLFALRPRRRVRKSPMTRAPRGLRE